MAIDFTVVVSSENSSYLAWQTLLFCFSAVTRLGKMPVVVVHHTPGPMRPEFILLREWGCRVIEAPSYLSHPLRQYPPRNELGSLLTIAEHPDFTNGHLLFCEPDMLFAEPTLIYNDELSAEHYSYLHYEQNRIRSVAKRFGVARQVEERSIDLMIGVPYLIPCSLLSRIAQRWIDVLDAFTELEWIDIMYAFGITLAVEDLPVSTTRFMTDNLHQLDPLNRKIIHYCYGDELWNKRWFREGESPLDLSKRTPHLKGISGTIIAEIFSQIRQARVCTSFPLLSRVWSRTVKYLC